MKVASEHHKNEKQKQQRKIWDTFEIPSEHIIVLFKRFNNIQTQMKTLQSQYKNQCLKAQKIFLYLNIFVLVESSTTASGNVK